MQKKPLSLSLSLYTVRAMPLSSVRVRLLDWRWVRGLRTSRPVHEPKEPDPN
jgi:hypothetical protein